MADATSPAAASPAETKPPVAADATPPPTLEPRAEAPARAPKGVGAATPDLTLAATGLAVQFGLQAAINMASTIQLIPAKGMTLPFISYGGSSMLALSIGMGLLLAFTRRNPYLTRSPYVVKWSGESLST